MKCVFTFVIIFVFVIEIECGNDNILDIVDRDPKFKYDPWKAIKIADLNRKRRNLKERNVSYQARAWENIYSTNPTEKVDETKKPSKQSMPYKELSNAPTAGIVTIFLFLFFFGCEIMLQGQFQ